VVFTSREHVIALEPRNKGLLGITLLCAVVEQRYPCASLDSRISNPSAKQMTNAELYAVALGSLRACAQTDRTAYGLLVSGVGKGGGASPHVLHETSRVHHANCLCPAQKDMGRGALPMSACLFFLPYRTRFVVSNDNPKHDMFFHDRLLGVVVEPIHHRKN
jgi:hypothetical protein